MPPVPMNWNVLAGTQLFLRNGARRDACSGVGGGTGGVGAELVGDGRIVAGGIVRPVASVITNVSVDEAHAVGRGRERTRRSW